MKLRVLYTIHAVIALVFGLGSVLVPQQFVLCFGVTLDSAGALMMQFAGAWLIGIALLAWFVRDVHEAEIRYSILVAFVSMSVVGLLVSLLGQAGGVLNAFGWLPALINLLLILGYGYFLLTQPEDAAAPLTQQTQQP
jgi:hypothetical protein